MARRTPSPVHLTTASIDSGSVYLERTLGPAKQNNCDRFSEDRSLRLVLMLVLALGAARGLTAAVLSMLAVGYDTVLALLAPSAIRKAIVAQLMVRNLPDELVRALKQRAAKRNHSAEQEHREILKAALKGPQRKPLADVLASMPNVGTDADFAREQADRRR